MTNICYRRDIDRLRAIAVGIVVAYRVIAVLAIILVPSLDYSQQEGGQVGRYAFFALSPGAWELAIGALLAASLPNFRAQLWADPARHGVRCAVRGCSRSGHRAQATACHRPQTVAGAKWR